MNFDKDTGVFDKDELDEDLETETPEVSFSESLESNNAQIQTNKRKGQRTSQYEVEVRRTVEDILELKRQREKHGDELFDYS